MWSIGRTYVCCLLVLPVLSLRLGSAKLNTTNDVSDVLVGEVTAFLKIIKNSSVDTDEAVLEVVWTNVNIIMSNTFINIWRANPEETPGTPVKSFSLHNMNGRVMVESVVPPNFLDILPRMVDANQSCLNYWIGLVVNKTLRTTTCITVKPAWMANMKNEIAEKKITELAIPGLNSDAALVLVSGRVSSWPQLIMGFRYLELDVVHKLVDSKDTFSLTRKSITTPFEVYLKEIMEFMRQTKELVFLEINLIPYSSFIDPEIFYSIQKLIYDNCKTAFVPRKYSSSLTYDSAWKLDRRLVFYWYTPFESKSILAWDKVKTIDYSYLFSKGLDFEVFLMTQKYHNKVTAYKLVHKNDSYEQCLEFLSFLKDENLWPEVNFVIVSCNLLSDVVTRSIEANIRRKNESTSVHPRAAVFPKPNIAASPINEAARHQTTTSEARVWLTLRAQGNNKIYRAIQLNWRAPSISEDNSIALFQQDPVGQHLELPLNIPLISSISGTLHIAEHSWNDTQFTYMETTARNDKLRPIFIVRPYTSLGHVTTNFTMNRPSIEKLNSGGCLGYWITFLENSTVIHSECFKSNPRWMWDNRDLLSSRMLRSLILPGTHNSGVASVEDLSNMFNAWIVCQDEEVIAQLLYGIRYLDLRISYYPDTKELLWISHDAFRWTPLRNVLEQIKAFSSLSKDPVIVDVHRTPVGFDRPEAKILLVSIFEEVLGDQLLPASVGRYVLLRDIWRTERNIIVSYGTYSMRQKHNWIWPPIYQAWANTEELVSLGNYLDSEIERGIRNNYFWAAMGQLTGTVWDVLFDHTGIRGDADKVGWYMTEWLRLKWKTDTNILTTDFLHTTNVISVAIELNLGKSLDNNTDNYWTYI